MLKTLTNSALLFILFCGKISAQLSGTYNVPGTYTSIAAAITDLNTQGISGSVLINISAGYAETAPAGGYALTATGNAFNSITFAKSGAGANPLISAYSGGVATPLSATQDGVWRLIGSDYVTIDGIDIQDLNVSNPATMEYGYGLFKASVADGCQNNVIKNCVITLNRVNNAVGSGPAVDGSRGINVVNSLAGSQTSALTPTAASGNNSNNKFYGNVIQNCNVGISIIGYAAPSPYALADRSNDVGGTSALTGNSILNFGGAASAVNPAAAIRTLAQYDLRIAYNTINNNNGSGLNHVTTLRGIYINAAAGANTGINNNTVTLNSGAVTAPVAAIENVSGAGANNNTISINSNLISNSNATLNTTGSFYGIFNNGGSSTYLEIADNSFNAVNTTATSGNNYLIYNTGAVTGAITITNNAVFNYTNQTSASGAFYGIFNNVPSSAILLMSSNTFSNCVTSAATGVTQYIYNGSAISNSIGINSNAILNSRTTISSTGAFYGIFNGGTSSIGLDMNLNSYNGHTITATSGAVHLLYNTAATSNYIRFNNNIISNSTNSVTGGGSYVGVYNNAASTAALEMNNNSFLSNISAASTGSVHLIYNRGISTNTYITASLSNNLLSNCIYSASSTAPFLGVYNVGVTSGDLSISNNTVTGNNWLTINSTRYLLCNTGVVNNNLNFNSNLITNNTSTINTSGVYNAILNTGNCLSTLAMSTNTISNNDNRATTGGAYYIYNSGAVPSGIITVTNNLISSNTNSVTGAGDFYAVFNQGTTYSTLTMSGNMFNFNLFSAFSGATNLLYNTGAVSTSINNIFISNNLAINSTVTVLGGGAFYGMYNNSASALNLEMSNNAFMNLTVSNTTGANHFIYNRGTVSNTFSTIGINSNLISTCIYSSGSSAPFYTIWNNGVTSAITSIASNTVTDINWLTATGLRYLISNWGVGTTSTSINGNLLSGHTHTNNSTGSLFYIYNNNNTSASSGTLNISNNIITNNQSIATSGETHLINSSGVTSNTFSAINFLNNNLNAYTSNVTAAGPFYGIYNNTASSSNLNFSSNTFSNITVNAATGGNYFIYNRGVATTIFGTVSITNNLFSTNNSSISSNGSYFGILNLGAGTTSSASLTINNNTLISSYFNTTAGAVNMINNACPTNNLIQISANVLSDITNTLSTTGNFFGINNSGASTVGNLFITNNSFTNLISTATSGSKYMVYNNGIISNSIAITGNTVSSSSHSVSAAGSFHGIYNNSSGSGFGLELSNNLFTNNSCYAATGNTYLFLNSGLVSNTITNVSIKNNAVTNFTSSATSGPFYGIYNSGFTSSDLAINSNTLNGIISLATVNTRQLIFNNGRITNAININTNLLSNFTSTLNTTGTFYGIGNTASFANSNYPASLTIDNNLVQNYTLTSTNGPIYLISNTGVASNTVSSGVMSNNLCSGITTSINAGGNFFGIYNTSITSSTLGVISNSFVNINSTSTTSPRTMLFNGGQILGSAIFSNNLISGITSSVNTTASYFGISNSGNSSGDLNFINNSIQDHVLSVSSGSTYAIYNTGGITGSINAVGNMISNISTTASSSGGFLGIYNNAGSSSALNMSNNTFTTINLTTSTGGMLFFQSRAASVSTINTINISNNTVGSVILSANSGPFYGVYNNGTAFANLSVNSNSFLNISTSATASARYFVFNAGAGSAGVNISGNYIVNFTSPLNTTGIFYGLFNAANCTGNLSITGNSINTLTLSATTGASYLIYNAGIISGSTSINTNLSATVYHSATSGAFYGIFNNGSSPANISIASNSIVNVVSATSTGLRYLFYNASNSNGSISLDNNTLSNFTGTNNTTANFFGVYNTGHSSANLSASGNVLNGLALASTTGTNYMVYNTGTLTGVANFNNNLIANCTSSSSAAGTFYGITNLASTSSGLNMSNNSFSTSALFIPSSSSYLVYNSASSPTISISSINLNGNTISNLSRTSQSANYYGVFNNQIAASNLSMSNNSFTNCSSSATSGVTYLVYNSGSVTTSMSLSGNIIAGHTSSLNASGDFYGVYNSAISQGNLQMNANAFLSDMIDGIDNSVFLVYNSASVANGIAMNSNTISACTNVSVTSGHFFGLYNGGATGAALSMSSNRINNNSSAVATGSVQLIVNAALASNSININGNLLDYGFTNNSSDYSGNLHAIYNANGSNTSSLSVSSNSFSGFPFSGINGTGNIYFIHNVNNNAEADFSGNIWNNLSLKHNGNEYLIYNPSGTQNKLSVTNNSIVTGYTRTGSAGSMFIYHSNGNSPATCTQTFSGNSFSNITATLQSTGSFYGLYSMDGLSSPYPQKQVFNNNISNVNYNGLGFMYGYYFDFLGDAGGSLGSAIHDNTISTVFWAGPAYGLAIGNNVSPTYTASIYSNLIQNINTSGSTSDLHGLQMSGGGAGMNVYKNKISDLSANGNLGTANGITISNAVKTNLFNNVVGNIMAPSSSYTGGINGIAITGGNSVNLFYNTIYLNTASTGSVFSSSALYAAAGTSLNLQNNVLINLSSPSGSGLSCAFWRGGSTLSTYSANSNNNIFHAGIPSSSHLVYFNGTAYPTLPSFQALVAPRDNASVYENTSFLSTTGTNANFLHVDNTLPSLSESGAQNAAGIADDIDTQVRQGNFGYVGTGTAPDIGADEYNPSLVPCSNVNPATVTVPATSLKCSGQEIYMLSTAYTSAGSITYQWKVSGTAGGTYTNVAGGSGSNALAYNTATLGSGTYYYVMVTTCNLNSQTATSNELTVTINPMPTATASILNSTVCAGESLSLTASSNIGTNYNWVGPNNFTTTTQAPVIGSVSANASGVYSLVVSNANCTANPVFVSALVNPTPPSFSLSPASASLCIGNSQTISASIPLTTPTLTIGSQAGQNSASGYPAPYSIYYGGQKMQMLVLATELSSAGFTGGTPITSLQFPVVSKGSNWGSVVNDCQNFMVAMKATTVSSFTGFESAMVNVSGPTNYTPTVGYGNIHTFSAPFIWDGTSNLVIETVFSNSIIGTSANAVIHYNSPTGFLSTQVYRADNQNVNAIAAATSTNVNVGFVRPDFKLNGTPVGSYSWSPSAGLSSATTPTVVASPTISGIYSSTLSNGTCFSSASMSVHVVLIPTLSIVSTATNVCIGNNATLTASGAATYTWNNNTTNSTVVVSPFGTTSYTVTGTNPSCPNATTSIQLVSSPALTLTALANPPILCVGDSSKLSVSGANNYTWTGGANTNSLFVKPLINTSYTVSADSGPGCWASKVVTVKVNTLPLITIAPPSVTVCSGDFLTLEAMGVLSFTWLPGNSNSPILMLNPVQSNVYQVTGVDLNNCVNTASVSVMVDPCNSILENSNQSRDFKFYPNPSSGIVYFEFATLDVRQIIVTNNLGQVIKITDCNTKTRNLNLSEFSKGIYFIQVFQGSYSTKHKLIVD